jgi:hypothetical protein
MPIAKAEYSQSNFDLTLEAVGSLDSIVKLCKQSGIYDLNSPIPSLLSYNIDDIINKKFTGYDYSTRFFGVDSDAQRFINACALAGINLTLTQQNAITQLVLDLKGKPNSAYATSNIWGKFFAIYPMIGGSALSHKFNLKDPRDLDIAFRLVFVNSPTHDSNGVTWNGSTQYARTFFIGTMQTFGDSHLSYYTRTNSTGGSGMEMGYYITVSQAHFISIRKGSDAGEFAAYDYTHGSFGTVTDSRGLWVNNSKGLVNTIYKNGTSFLTGSISGSNPLGAVEYYIGSANSGAVVFSTKQCAFASIGTSFTDKEAFDYRTAVQAYQTKLSRQV